VSIFFLDLSLRTGWAADSAEPGRPVTGLLSLVPPGGNMADGWRYGRTFESLRSALTALVPRFDPRLIGFEAPISKHQTSAKLLVTLAGIVEMVGYQFGIDVVEAHLSTIKKHFTGDGHAEKTDMLKMCRTLGWDVGRDHNRADAAAGWSYLKSLHDASWGTAHTPLFGGGARA
jgi:hypothetical protein